MALIDKHLNRQRMSLPIAIQRGEFQCPQCRRISNFLVPLVGVSSPPVAAMEVEGEVLPAATSTAKDAECHSLVDSVLALLAREEALQDATAIARTEVWIYGLIAELYENICVRMRAAPWTGPYGTRWF